MKTPHKYKAKNYGAYSSPPVVATLTKSEVTSFAELRETISLMLLLLQIKQQRGSRLAAEVNISIYRTSTKTDCHTPLSGTPQSGPCQTKDGESYVQGILPLTYHTSARKQKNSGSKWWPTASAKPSSSQNKKPSKSPPPSPAKAKKST